MTSRRSQLALTSTFALLSLVVAINQAYANTVKTDNIWIRDYFDFAQNKGAFKPGTTNLHIVQKNGSILKLPDLPMPDFSPVSNNGTTTHIGRGFVVTAKHNEDNAMPIMWNQHWDASHYKFVDSRHRHDFAVEKLNKFIVESDGATGREFQRNDANWQEQLRRYGVEYNGQHAVMGFRVGTGKLSYNKNGQIHQISQAYIPEFLSASMFWVPKWNHGWNNLTEFFNNTSGGDSGSAWWVYDKIDKKWVILGTHYGRGHMSVYNPWDQLAVDETMSKFTVNVGLNGQSGIFDQDHKFTVNGTSHDYSNHKDIVLSGGGTLELTKDLNMGASGLVFGKNESYKIVSQNDGNFALSGAGVDIGEGSTVDWFVRGNANEDLHKVGLGTLKVHTTQGNRLKVGTGLVELNAEKTFNGIYMTSGNGTIKLGHANALPNEGDYAGIYFSKNGGTLDLNGHDFNVVKIAAADFGAHITNKNTSDRSNVSIKTKDPYIFHGQFSGALDVNHEHDQRYGQAALVLDGGVDIDGDINVAHSTLVLQGHAVTHATYSSGRPATHNIIEHERPDAEKYDKDYMITNNPSEFNQPDWETRLFKFKELTLRDADLQIGRNTIVEGAITADHGEVRIGGNGTLYLDRHDGKNIWNNGFGFQQGIATGTSQKDETIRYTGHITGKNSSTIDSWIPLLNASLDLQEGSRFTQHGESVNVLQADGIKVAKNASATFDDILVSSQKAPVSILNDGGTLSLNVLSAKHSDVIVRGATINERLEAYDQGSVDIDRWVYQNDNLWTDDSSRVTIGDFKVTGFNAINANLTINDRLYLDQVSANNAYYGMHAKSLLLKPESGIKMDFSDDQLSLANFSFDKDYVLVSAEKLDDQRLNEKIDFSTLANVHHLTNQTNGNKITFQFHEKPLPPPVVDPEKPQKPTPESILTAFNEQSSTHGSALMNALMEHNANSQDKYQEVAFSTALRKDDVASAVGSLNAIVERTEKSFDFISQQVDRQTMMSPVRSSINSRLTSLRTASYKGVQHYQLASAGTGDLSMIGRAMAADNQHQSVFVDLSAGLEKKEDQKSHVTSTAIGVDHVTRTQDGKNTFGVLASFGKLTQKGNSLSDDGNLYSITGYTSFERPDVEGLEFLSYLTLGYLNSERTHVPDIQLGNQVFKEKHWMAMSSNTLKYNVPLPQRNDKFRYSFKPMVLADLGFMHSKATESTYFKRDSLNDFTVDLGLGVEYEAHTPESSYSLQLTARRNVYHSADQVGVNLSKANGFINYDLTHNKSVLFNVNAMTTQQINDDITVDLMLGAGADTEGKKTAQGTMRLHWKF